MKNEIDFSKINYEVYEEYYEKIETGKYYFQKIIIKTAYYSVRGEIEKAYAAIINGDDIISTLNALNDEANAILADAIEN